MPHYHTRESTLQEQDAIQVIKDQSYSLTDLKNLNKLMDRIGDARIVMLGEASHGTHEYYTWRSLISQRLIKEKETRPLIKNLSNEQLKGFIIKKFSDRKIYYEQADIIIDEDPVRLENLVEKIFHA